MTSGTYDKARLHKVLLRWCVTDVTAIYRPLPRQPGYHFHLCRGLVSCT